ncbi:hypothetical protein IDSA_11325 [Pseudidiomarina salinarum]|uniref:DUF2971 domain-containing protein n=1 Tax=Pseudidiomarina salinarum TaxID=435908 RepID=A0A094IR33_9GAMM|nr:DUF2971 domain-containing protein [Pseudidiomarina salinarum]KFZ30145.1 hypothetical protein IDSA_11325 [Pseudidiomarina salinarum]RUO68648.1 DUF2971 domain-containing protein [Pseudidiomarina salinarum]
MLYKYFGPERVDVMRSLSIRFSPLLSLNDPFECLPLVEARSAKEMLISEVIRDFEELWEKTDEDEKTDDNWVLLEKTRENTIANIENKFKASNTGSEVVAMLGDNFGILSLSRTEKNILMWSHYAAEGRGFVIGLDENHPFFHQKDARGRITKPLPVVYTTVRSTVSPRDARFYEKFLCEKALEWADEEEERVFRFLENIETRSIGKDQYGQSIVLTHLPKETIQSVFLGYRADTDLMDSVFQAIEQNEIECDVYRARICDNEYRIVFDQLLRA